MKTIHIEIAGKALKSNNYVRKWMLIVGAAMFIFFFYVLVQKIIEGTLISDNSHETILPFTNLLIAISFIAQGTLYSTKYFSKKIELSPKMVKYKLKNTTPWMILTNRYKEWDNILPMNEIKNISLDLAKRNIQIQLNNQKELAIDISSFDYSDIQRIKTGVEEMSRSLQK